MWRNFEGATFMKIMNMSKTGFAIPTAIVLAMMLTACGDTDDGKAEKMGAQIDQAVEQAKSKVEEAKDSVSNAMEKAGDKMEEAGDRVEDKTD